MAGKFEQTEFVPQTAGLCKHSSMSIEVKTSIYEKQTRKVS